LNEFQTIERIAKNYISTTLNLLNTTLTRREDFLPSASMEKGIQQEKNCSTQPSCAEHIFFRDNFGARLKMT